MLNSLLKEQTNRECLGELTWDEINCVEMNSNEWTTDGTNNYTRKCRVMTL